MSQYTVEEVILLKKIKDLLLTKNHIGKLAESLLGLFIEFNKEQSDGDEIKWL